VTSAFAFRGLVARTAERIPVDVDAELPFLLPSLPKLGLSAARLQLTGDGAEGHSANDARDKGTTRPDRSEREPTERLNPLVAWSIVLVGSLLLWWGLWLAISALVSALR